MKRAAAICAVLTLLGGCKQDDIKAGKELAARDLLDPTSAQFRDLTIKDRVVCGQINGKNRLGAYTGFRGFIARVDAGIVIAEPSDLVDLVPGSLDIGDLADRKMQALNFSVASTSLCGRYVGTSQALLDEMRAGAMRSSGQIGQPTPSSR